MSSQVYENPIAEDAAEWYSHRQDALEAIGGYSNLRERERRQLDRLLGTETDADIVRIATRAFIMRKESERIRSRELAGR